MCKSENHKHNLEVAAIDPILNELGICRENIVANDRPDIILQYDGRKIGIEVMGCHPSSILNGAERSFMSNSRCEYDIISKYKKRFAANHPNTMLSVRPFIEILCGVKRINENAVFEEIDARLRNERRKYNYIESADISCNSNDYYTMVYGGIIEPIDEKYVRYCIDEKEQKLISYKKEPKNADISEYWLVIGFNEENLWRIDQLKMDEPITEYSRVYLTLYSEMNRIK